jgi:predicted  nucleic acid-binding Zn-ribbon protein
VSDGDWTQQFRVDVESIQAAAREQKKKAEASGISTDLRPEYALLESRLEELRRRLASKAAHVQAGTKEAEALKARIAELTVQLESAEDRAAAQQREAVANAAMTEELAQTLRVAAEARAKLLAALDKERREHRTKTESLLAEKASAEAGLRSSLKETEDKLNAAERERAALKSDFDGLSARFETLKLELAAKEMEAAKLSVDLERGRSASAEAEKAKAQFDDLRGRILAKEAEIAKLNEDLRRTQTEREDALARIAKIQGDAARAMENAEAVRREGNDAMDEAQALKEKVHRDSEESRARFEEMRGELRLRAQKEIGEARAQLDSERAALFAQLDSERARTRAEADLRLNSERERLKALSEKLKSLESLRAEQSAEREQMLREVHEKLQEEKPLEEVPPEPAPKPEPAPEPAVAAAAAPETAKTPGKPSGWRWAVAGFVVLAGAAAVAASLRFMRPIPGREYSIPFSHPSALVWSGDSLWAADWVDAAIFKLRLEEGRLSLVAKYPMPGSRISGLAVTGDALYLADSGRGVIEKRKLDDALTVDHSWLISGGKISALGSDGRSLYAASSGRINKYALEESLPLVSTYFAPPAIVGMAFGETELWSADSESRLFLRHRLDETLGVKNAYGLAELDTGTKPLSCFTRKGDEVWFGRDGDASLKVWPARGLASRRQP